MAVTIIKNFWNGTEYKSIAKIVFTSPNFTSPYQAGTRSHMQPGGLYMGTWYEAVDFMYRQLVNQDYVELPDEMEGFFGRVTVDGAFDFSTDTTLTVLHEYGNTFDLEGPGAYPNILYRDRDNYGSIVSASGTGTAPNGQTITDIILTDVVGDAILNEWGNNTTSGTIIDTITGLANPVGELTTLSEIYTTTVIANDEFSSDLSGDITAAVSGIMYSVENETVSGTLNGEFSGLFTGVVADGLGTPASSTISSAVSVAATGHDYGTTLSGILETSIAETMSPIGEVMTTSVSGMVTTYTSDSTYTTISGLVGGELSGTVISGTVYPNVSGTLSGTVTGILEGHDFINDVDVYSSVSGTMVIPLTGLEHVMFNSTDTCSISGVVTGPISGTVSGTIEGSFVKPSELLYHQYSDAYINEASTVPRPRRHHGENSIIFSITFGEAYDCRLTAWDDDTHSTTLNKVLTEEHYRVDAATYRSNMADTAHSPTFRKTNNLVFPPAIDVVLKGDERYYGNFDLIFSIEADEYGEYLAFIPRLVDIDESFIAGSYDFVTTLHYQYT